MKLFFTLLFALIASFVGAAGQNTLRSPKDINNYLISQGVKNHTSLNSMRLAGEVEYPLKWDVDSGDILNVTFKDGELQLLTQPIQKAIMSDKTNRPKIKLKKDNVGHIDLIFDYYKQLPEDKKSRYLKVLNSHHTSATQMVEDGLLMRLAWSVCKSYKTMGLNLSMRN